MNSQVRSRANFRKLMPAVVGATLLTAVIFGFSGINANAATVSSDSNQCQFTVGDSTGVTSALSGGKCLVKFTSVRSTTWTAPQGVTSFNVLVVAGGGGGGADGGSGGGSGSLVETTVSLNGNTSPTFDITVGGGGGYAQHTPLVSPNVATPGGSSQIRNTSLGFSLTTYGGGGGAWASTTTVGGGSGGGTPTVSAGSLTLSSTNSQAGKTGASADTYNEYGPGKPGVAGVTSGLFGGTYIGSGGSGARMSNPANQGGNGGSGGGGRGSGGYGPEDDRADYFASAGTAGTGGGGGGGARHGTTALITIDGVSGYSRNGAAGGSGIVVIAYTPPDISVVTAGNGVRINSDLLVQPVLQLRNSADQSLSQSGVQVTVSTSSGTLSGNTATSISTGRVTFTNLRFTSGTPGTTATLTFSAPGYLNATQTIKIQTLSTGITISSSASSNGNFVEGQWFSNTATTSNILNSELVTQLNSRNVTIESTGNISATASVTSSASNSLSLNCSTSGTFSNNGGVFDLGGNFSATCGTIATTSNILTSGSQGISLTATSQSAQANGNLSARTSSSAKIQLKAVTNVEIGNSVGVNTAGGAAVLWSRSASTDNTSNQSGDGYIQVGNGASISTSGGPIVLAGSSSVDANGFPSGHAYKGSSSGFAVRLGTSSAGAGLTLNSGGGDIRVYGQSASSASHAFAGNIGSGNTLLVDSGTGTQDWKLVSSQTGDNVWETWGGNLEIRSAAPANPSIPAINVYIRQTNSLSGFTPIQQVTSSTTKFIASGGGDISFEATSAKSTVYAFDNVDGLQFLANGGDINVNFGANGINLVTASTSTPAIFGAVSGSTTTSNVTISSDRFGLAGALVGDSSGFVVRTSGDVKIQPSSTSFQDEFDLDRTWSFIDQSNLTLGKEGNTQNISLTAPQNLSGNLNVLGGACTNTGGAVTTAGTISILCTDITTSAALTAGGNLTLDNSTTTGTSAITVNANLMAGTAGGSILLKSKSDIVTGNSVNIQTAGRSSGVGGNIVLWSDADASGEGYIQIGRNPVFNSVGGSTSTFSGGGDIHFGGGLDNGAATVVAGRASGDDIPDGWAVSSTTMGVWVGYLAASGDTIKMHSGGGKISIFGKSSGASDALAFNWTTQVDSGEGQIEIRGESGGWGIQLNRSGSNDTYNSRSHFTSRSDSHPAIYIKGKSSGNSGYMALLGSYGDAGTDNLVIQATGAGGIDLIADGPSNHPAMGLQSTAVLSASGKITIDGGTSATSGEGGIHFGSIYNGATQGSVQIGECATSTCANSLVTSSSADIDIIGNRVSTFGSLSTTIDTSGELAILPAVGSTAFTDFQSKTSGLTLDSQLGGLQIGREGDNTNAMRIANNWTIAGPIAIHGAQIYIDQDLETTGSATSPIRLRSLGQVYTGPSVDLVTNGSDVVFWSGANEAAGAANNTIYVSNGSTITTNGGKIWLAGGLDDGGTNALITPDRGKWSTVVADDGLPDGYASGENSANEWAHGVLIGSGSKLLSGGGDIFIAGSAGPSSAGYAHIALYPGAQIDSGTGRIAMWGRSFTGHTTQGIAMPWGDGGAPVMVTSNAASSDAISIYSDSSAGASWSRGIIAYWYGALDAARGYQGSQVLATASGGGITMTGIGSAAGDTSDGPHGLYLDFIDIMAIDGPITLNGDGGSSGWSMGAAFGWRNNLSAVIRLGGWAKGDTTANGGGVITTPGGVTADFTSSSSDVTINVDTFWNRQSSNGMYGVYVTTSGDFKILPAAMDSGLIVPSDNFRYSTQSSTDWSFEKLLFLATPESIQIGRPETTTVITVAAELRAHGAISVYGSALSFSNNLINESGRGPILLKSTSTVTLAANKTYETNGSDIVLWGGSAGGNGYILLDNGVCVNTNASCDLDASVATGNIYMGGGSAGTTYPTGPVVDSGYRGIRFGTSGSGIKVLSGGGDISLKGQSNLHGIEFWQGAIVKATTGAITMEGTSTSAGNQGFRIAAATGSTVISSGKTSGIAISITGRNTVPGSDLSTSSTRGIYIADSTSQILATAGGDIVLNSSVGTTTQVFGAQLSSVTIESTGGDTLYSGARFDLSSSTLRATDGGSIQIKSTGHITPGNSTIQTSGPLSGSGGEISIWSDSDGDDNGVIHTNGSMCINTVGSCINPTATGGSKIVLGGGSTADSTGFFPAGGAPSSGSFMGIRLGSADVADQMKIWSGGGDISIRSKSATATNGISGQYWYGGTNVNSGDGAIVVENIVGSTSASIQSYGIDIRANSYPITVTSSKATGEAIRVVSQVGVGAEWSSAVLVHNGSNSIRTTFSATGGGDIYMEGTVAGTNTNTYSLDFSNTDILASTGNITLKGNRGTWWNRLGSGSSNVGALSTGAAEGDITIEGNRFVSSSTALPLNFKTTGTLTIKPIVGQSFIHDVSFPNTGINLSDLSGLTVGASGNTRSLTAATAANVAGPITYEGGAFTGSGALTNTGSGAVSILSSSTVALNANLSSGAGGILVKSVGRISTSGGASAAAPRSLGTAAGPITLWTTGADGGVTLSNFTKIDTTLSGTAGADITIGGGAADVQDPSLPSGKATSSTSTGILLGSSDALDNFVVRAGSGAFNVRGESTLASASASGVRIFSGANIQAGTVEMVGKGLGTATANNTSSGVFIYGPSAIKTVIEATASFSEHTEALVLDSEMTNGTFATLLGNGSSTSVADFLTFRTTGAKAAIRIRGNSGSSGNYSLFLAGAMFSTYSGNLVLDGGDDLIVLSRSGAARKSTVTTNNSGPGGDVTIKSAGIDSETGGSFDVSTGGVLSFVPQASQDFSLAQTFPPASSVINTGGLIVGSATNTQDLTLGSAVSASGDVKFIGGDQTAAFNITTTSSGNIEFYPTGSFSKSTNVLSAGGDIVVGTKLAPASNATLSTSTLSASGDVRVFSSGSLTQTAGISAVDAVELVSTAGDVLVQKSVSSGPGGIVFKASRNVLMTNISMAIDSNGGDLVIWSNASGAGGEVDTGGTLVSFISDGGDIIVGGGADDGANGGTASDGIPDNYVLGGTASNTSALRLGANMSSGSGTITLRADHGSGSRTNAKAAIYLATSVELAATTGNINIFGRQSSGNTSTSNQYGVWLGGSSSSLTRAKITTTSGNIYISGESSQSVADNRRGIVLYGVEISAGGDVTLIGTSPDRTGNADILSWTQSVIDAGGDVLLRGSRVSYLELTEITAGSVLKFEVGNLDASSNGLSTASVTYTPLAIKGSGTVVVEPYSASFISSLNLNGVNPDLTITGLTVGKAGNQSAISTGTSKTISGPIAVFADLLTVNSSLNTSSSNSSITLLVDRIDVSSQINAGTGIVSIEPQTANRGITVAASDSAADLSFTPTELGLLSAGTLRLTTLGDVSINSSVNFSGKVSSLAIRAGGDVTGAAGAVLTVDNLGVYAGGTINFPGNQVASVVALNASAVTYNQSGDYSVAAVDGIDPEFGYGVKFAISNVPTSGTLDAFMAVAFNPPPIVKILDKFNNVLAVNNTSAADYAVTPTLTVVSSSGTPTLAGTTPTRSGGTFTFSSLNVVDATAEVTLTFSATRSGVALSVNSSFDDGSSLTVQASPTFTTTSYKVQAGEPTSISIALTSTSAQAGKTGFGITATLKDTSGNTIATGPHATATISVSIAGTNGTIVSGDSPTTAAGVADFSDLILGGSVETDYTLTFSVTYTDTQSESQTVTETQVVTLTPGDATRLDVSPATQTQATGQVLSDITVSILDAYDNIVTSSTDAISIAMSAGSNGGSANVVGYSDPVAATSGQVVFNTLGINGTVGNYTITFSSGSLATDTHVATITHSVAHHLGLSIPTTAKNDVALSTDPIVTVYDVYDNIVESFVGDITLSVDSGSLSGAVSMDAVAGVADFDGKGVKLLGLSGTKSVTATAASLSNMSTSENVSLTFGPAVALDVTTPAAGFMNRVNFSTQPIVTVEDSSRNPVEDFAGDVLVAVSGTNIDLDGTKTISLVDADNGVAEFSDLSLRGEVGSYSLSFETNDLASDSQTVELTHGAPTQIAITQSAIGARSGQVFDTPMALEIQDADGNVTDTGLGATAQIAVTKQEAGFLLGGADFGGTLIVTASSGVATFGDLKLSGAVGDYNLSFAISSPLELSGFNAATETITLAAGSKSTISIVEQPVDAEAGVAFSPVVTVEVLDAWGNRVLADSSSTISAQRVDLANVSVFETLQTETVTSGLATFTGMNVETIGDFKIRFTSASVDPVLSDQFTVRHGPASKLVLTTNPTSARSDVAFTSVLRLLDQYNNAVTTGPEFTISASVVSANNADVLSLTGNETTSSPGTEILIYSQMKLKAPTGTYQLRYTATDGTNTFSIDSNNIVLGYGNPAQLNIATEAATALAGEAFGTQPIIEIQDSAGNLVANSSLPVTASVPGKSLVGTEGVAAIGGIANFSSSGLGIAGTVDEGLAVEYEIEYPAGNFITASHAIDLLAGPTRYLHILEQPTELVTRGTFSPGVAIQLRDQYQNPVLSDSTTSVSALLYGADDAVATATVGEPAIQAISASAVSGVVDFSSLSYAVAPANGYYLKFSLPSNLDVVDSSSFTVVPGAVASISIDQQPSTTNLDNSLVKTGELLAAMPEVSLYDQDGYLADNASGSVSVSIASGNGGDLSEGATTAIINSGRAVFSGVKLVGTPLQGSVAAEQYELKFSFNGVDSASSDLLSVTHNVASKLILQRSASGGRAGEPFTQQPIIEVQDRYSNIVENSNAQIRAGASAGARITSGREVNAQSGIATFTSLGLGGLTTGTYQLTFEIPNTSVTNVAQSNITLTYGFADHLGITTAPASLDSNGDLTKTGSLLEAQPVVKVYDADNNVVESSNDIITVSYVSTFDDRDRLEGETLQAVNGVAAFQDLKLIARPGQNYTLNFTSGELGNTQSETLQVRHADPDSIEITTQPSAVIDSVNGILTRTGNALAVQPQIRILDFDGNHADSATGVNVVATVVSGGGTAVGALDASGRAFNEAVITAGAAAFSELKLVATPGVAQEIAFSAAFPTGTISSVSSDQLTLTNGLAQSLAMHVEPCAGADDGVTCNPGVTGEALEVQPTVKVLDAYGNLVVDHVGEIVAAVTSSGARLSVSDSDDVTLRTIAVAGGYANFSGLELTAIPGTPVSIGFSSQGLAGVSSRDLVVGSAGASRIEMLVQPIGERTGSEFSTQPTIKLVDRFGNTVTGDSASVITVSASGGNLFLDPEGPLTAVANQGVVSFTGLRFTGTPGAPYQLSFTSAGLTPATSADFSVTNAFANNLVITQQPTSGKTGDRLTQMPILELRDFDGNLAEDDNDTVVAVTIDVSNGAASFVDEQDQSLVTAPSATASAGVVEFEGLRIVATPGTVYKLNFEATPLVGETFSSAPSGELVFTHANPAQLVVTQSALGGLAGEDLPTQPIIEIQDRFGNRATGDTTTVVTATIETGTSGDVLRGASVSAVDGVVSFTELALDGVPDQTYTLRYSAVSVFGDVFYVVDSDELTLSRPAALTLTMEPIYFAPDQVVAPVFTNDSQGVVTWTTTTDATICVLELDGNNEPTGNVIVKGVGTCSLKAEVARFDFTHLAAPQSSYLANEISANLVINKAAQAPLSMTSADNVNYRGFLVLASSGGSGTGAISYFVSGDCRVIGGVLLPGEAGANCVVVARKAGDANYERADSADQTIAINRIAQSPLYIGNARDVAVGDITLFTSGGTGGGEVSYQVSTVGSAACEILDGNILRATQNGTCGVMATKQSSTNYLVAISPEVTFSFSKMTQVVNFTSVVPSRPLPGTLFTPTAVASSELAVTITISAGEGTVCEFDSVETSSIRFLTSGNCVLTATQAGSDRFTAASSSLTIAVNAMNQTITFPSLSNKVFGEPKFELSATSSSGLPVAYALGSTFQNLGCSVTSAGMVTLTAAGMCEIIASQPGDASYLPAPDVVQIFSVAPDLAGAPHLVSVAVSNQAITARFRAPSYLGGSQVSAYRLEASNGEGDTYVNPGCSAAGTDLVCDLVGMPLTRQVDGETVAISYTVRVAAVTAAGIGVFSDSSPSVIPRSTDFAVMQLSGDQIDGQLEVTWAEPLAFDGEFVSYEVYVWPLNTAEPDEPTQTISSVTTESASFEMEDAQPTISSFGFSAFTQNISIPTANAYNLKVVTVTDTLSDDLDDINVASGVQIGLGAPGRPRNEVIEADSQQLKIFWSQPNSDGGSEVTHYMIRKSGEAAAPCEAVDPSSAEASGIVDESWNYSLNQPSALLYEQSGLSAGSSYEIAVFACNEIGASQPAILTHSIPAPPSPPAPVVPEEEVDVEEENSGESEEDGSESGSSSKPKPTTKPGSSSNPSPSDILNPGNETEVPTAPSESETPGPVSPEAQEPGDRDPETIDPESPEKPDAAGENPAGGIGNLMLLIWVVLLVILVLLVRFLRRKKGSLES